MAKSTMTKDLIVLPLVAAIISAAVLDNTAAHGVLISSDSLLPAAFVWQMLHHPADWIAFQHPRVPSIFPDLVVYGTLQAVTGDWRLAMALWFGLVMVWLLGIGSFIAARIGGCRPASAVHPFALLTIAVVATAMLGWPNPARGLDGSGYTYPYLFLFVLVTHGGPFLLAITTAVLAWHAARRPRNWNLALLAIAGWANGVSDLLCVASLLAPLGVALLGSWRAGEVRLRAVVQVVGIACASAVAGWACSLLLNRQAMPPMEAATMLRNAARFGREVAARPGVLLAAAGLGVPLLVLVRRDGWPTVVGAFWPAFAATSALGSLAIAIVMYEDVWSLRYALPFLWWPLMLTVGAMAPMLVRAAPVPAQATALIAGVLGGGYLATGWHAPALLTWRSTLAECLMAQELRAGLGDYWTARKTSAASQWKLQVEQIGGNGAAFLWGNNKTWYLADIHDSSRPPAFGFIVLDRLDQASISTTYGEPDGILNCDGSTVWTYDDPARLRDNLNRVSPTLASGATR